MAAISLLSDGDIMRSAAPSPKHTVAQTTQFIATATNQYTEEGLVDIRVQDRVFRVPQNRLALRSPFFRKMFTLSQDTDAKHIESVLIELDNDPTEFGDFLWYLHADPSPLSAYEFAEAEPSEKKCSTLLGIASVAHMYEALDIARWAMKMVIKILMTRSNRCAFTVNDALAKQLLRTAARFRKPADASFLSDARDVVCDAIYRDGPLSDDPILAVRLAQEVGDTYVLAHAYFYTLEKGEGYFLYDERLGAQDRRRILCGAFTLDKIRQKRGYSRTMLAVSKEPWERGSNGQYCRAWVVGVHPEIAYARGELWSMFDCERWRLTE